MTAVNKLRNERKANDDFYKSNLNGKLLHGIEDVAECGGTLGQ